MKLDCVCRQANHEHGTLQAYLSDRCRCQPCKTAHADNSRQRRRLMAYGQWEAKSVDNTGCRRRIEALACLGWSFTAIAETAGTTPRALWRLWTQTGVSPARARQIAAAYDEMWDKRAPMTTRGERISAVRTMRWAQRGGFLPPLAWDDELIDDPGFRPVKSRRNPVELKPCGTLAAYTRHLRAGEKPCLRCAEACRRRRDEAA